MTGRIVWTLLIEVIVFVVTIVLAMIDTSLYPGVFFYITMGSIVTLNSECYFLLQSAASCRLFATKPGERANIKQNYNPVFPAVANGVYQSTVFGLAAKLPFKYTGAVVLGTVSWCT